MAETAAWLLPGASSGSDGGRRLRRRRGVRGHDGGGGVDPSRRELPQRFPAAGEQEAHAKVRHTSEVMEEAAAAAGRAQTGRRRSSSTNDAERSHGGWVQVGGCIHGARLRSVRMEMAVDGVSRAMCEATDR
ncbi:hypothetical protein PVAP13_5NG168862 [Panicum virgatum]|uniref:Uncharacterized protein n=1 Tax=Panicum virgatum TaxID=38727 RepID=A0A8T0RSU8_PANVG|nr:hypothetical protein PVAP13_5NG168862 [Panicum virgatum]